MIFNLNSANPPLTQAQEEVTALTRALANLEIQLTNERQAGIPTEEAVEQQITVFEEKLAELSKQLQETKGEAKSTRKEMDQLNEQLDPDSDTALSEGRTKLMTQFSDLAVQLSGFEATILSIEGSRLALIPSLEQARQTLAAIQQGIYSLPVQSDPRFVALKKAKEEATLRLKALSTEYEA